MQYTIDPQILNAVNACSAINDIRYYLCSFFIDAEKDKIVGTNGHILAVAPIASNIPAEDAVDEWPSNGKTHGWLFQAMTKPLKKTALQTTIDTTEKKLVVSYPKSSEEIALLRIDGVYPDYERAQVNNGEGEPVPHIELDADYLSTISKWAHLKNGQCKLIFKDAESAFEVYYTDLPDLHVTLMPCRF